MSPPLYQTALPRRISGRSYSQLERPRRPDILPEPASRRWHAHRRGSLGPRSAGSANAVDAGAPRRPTPPERNWLPGLSPGRSHQALLLRKTGPEESIPTQHQRLSTPVPRCQDTVPSRGVTVPGISTGADHLDRGAGGRIEHHLGVWRSHVHGRCEFLGDSCLDQIH